MMIEYLKEFRDNNKPIISKDINIDCCRHCKCGWDQGNRFIPIRFNPYSYYHILCKKCFESDELTLEQIIKYYITKSDYQIGFTSYEYNYIIDSFEEVIENGGLQKKYEDYISKRRNLVIDNLLA